MNNLNRSTNITVVVFGGETSLPNASPKCGTTLEVRERVERLGCQKEVGHLFIKGEGEGQPPWLSHVELNPTWCAGQGGSRPPLGPHVGQPTKSISRRSHKPQTANARMQVEKIALCRPKKAPAGQIPNMLLCGLRMRDLAGRECTQPVNQTAKQCFCLFSKVFDEMTQICNVFKQPNSQA